MKNKIFTSLERSIITFRILTLLAWGGLVFVIFLSFLAGSFSGWFFLLVAAPFVIIELFNNNLYFPSHSYFRKYFFHHSKSKRVGLSKQSEMIEKYPHIGETVFLDSFVVFKNLGVIINYKDIKGIYYRKESTAAKARKNTYVCLLSIVMKNNKRYICRIHNDETAFVGKNCEYLKALRLSREKTKNKT